MHVFIPPSLLSLFFNHFFSLFFFTLRSFSFFQHNIRDNATLHLVPRSAAAVEQERQDEAQQQQHQQQQPGEGQQPEGAAGLGGLPNAANVLMGTIQLPASTSAADLGAVFNTVLGSLGASLSS